MNKRLFGVLTLCLGLANLSFVGCNVFDPLDKIKGDKETLSAARAAFDRGDYAEAADLYGKLSSDYAEVAASETAFKILAENGVTMGDFMSAFGKGGSPALGLSKLAGAISKTGPSSTKRLAYLTAFQKINQIPSNTELRGIVRFVAASALAAEVLAEDIPGQGIYPKTKLATNPASCVAPGCLGGCPNNSIITAGTAAPPTSLPTSGTTGGTANYAATTPTWTMFHAAIHEVLYALNSEVAGSGSLGGDLKTMTNLIATAGDATVVAQNGCYRATLLSEGFGE